MSSVKAKIAKYLNGWVFNGQGEDGLRMVCLRHVDSDERSSPINTWQTGKSDFKVAQVCDEIYEYAVGDSEGMRGVQSYVVHAYFGTDPNPGSRCPFSMEQVVSVDNERNFTRSEKADAKGWLEQSMRHRENEHALNVKGSAGIINAQQQTIEKLHGVIDKLNERLDKADARYLKTIDTYEELISKKHERDMQNKEKDAEIAQRAKVFQVVADLAPIAVNKITGKNLLPEPVSPKLLMVKSAFTQIPTEKWQKIHEILADQPHVLAILMELMKSLQGENGTNAAAE